jgi:hypothetical protein
LYWNSSPLISTFSCLKELCFVKLNPFGILGFPVFTELSRLANLIYLVVYPCFDNEMEFENSIAMIELSCWMNRNKSWSLEVARSRWDVLIADLGLRTNAA